MLLVALLFDNLCYPPKGGVGIFYWTPVAHKNFNTNRHFL